MGGSYFACSELLATLILLWLSSFCWTETCQVGEHGLQQVTSRERASRNTVYINTIDPASCDGVVYGWRLCFRSAFAGAVRMSMYRRGKGDSYHLVNGSVYELTLKSRISSYTCNDSFLDESEYFSVEQGDMVAVCWSNGNRMINIFSQNNSKHLVSSVGGSSCSQDVIDSHSQTNGREILLSAYINVDECELGEGMCHENAACSDVVGGEDSYNCTCNPGFSGDGFSRCVASGNDGGMESSIEGGGISGGVVAAVVVVLLLVVGALAVAAGLVGFVLYRRKKLSQQQLTPHTGNNIDNQVYGKHYDMEPEYNATPYEVPQESLRKDGHFSTLQSPVYEPTAGTNIYASPDPMESSLVYELPGDKLYKQTVASENIYESASPYQCPSKDEAGLYEQISSYNINVIRRRDIKIISHLGSGQFGSVNKAVWTNGRRQTTVAVKTLTDSDNTVKFLQEAAIMAQFKHPNILTLHGVVSAGDPKMIVVELMTNGDLKECLTGMRPDPGQLVPDYVRYQLLNFSKQVALGLHYLSCRGFVHRDLAARNILVSNTTCKIADFGMSRDLADENIYVSHGGVIPVRWTAPDALTHKQYSTASDVWSYGCVLYEIWSLGHKPFETTQIRKILQLVSTGYRLPPPPGCPKKIYKLMIDTWHPDASSRPQLRDVLKGLLGNVDEVLAIPPEDVPADSQAAVLGAPLDKATHLYQDLQNTYTV